MPGEGLSRPAASISRSKSGMPVTGLVGDGPQAEERDRLGRRGPGQGRALEVDREAAAGAPGPPACAPGGSRSPASRAARARRPAAPGRRRIDRRWPPPRPRRRPRGRRCGGRRRARRRSPRPAGPAAGRRRSARRPGPPPRRPSPTGGSRRPGPIRPASARRSAGTAHTTAITTGPAPPGRAGSSAPRGSCSPRSRSASGSSRNGGRGPCRRPPSRCPRTAP